MLKTGWSRLFFVIAVLVLAFNLALTLRDGLGWFGGAEAVARAAATFVCLQLVRLAIAWVVGGFRRQPDA